MKFLILIMTSRILYPNRVIRAMNTVSLAYRHIIVKFYHLIPSGGFSGLTVASPIYKTTWHIFTHSIYHASIP